VRLAGGQAAAVLLAAAATSGCGLLRHGAMGVVEPVTGNLARALQQQGDLELVRDGVPAFLLLLDGLVLSAPDNAGLRLASADAYAAYASAFAGDEDKARAAALFARARENGLAVLTRNRRFRAALEGPIADYEEAVHTFRQRDVPALYTTATAWAGWIIARSDSMEAIAQLPRALALMERVMELDRGYRGGGADLFYGIYCCIQPRGAGQDLAKARGHFEKALAYAGPDALMPRVVYAEFYARYTFDRELYEKLLREVLAAPDADRDSALMNSVARKRAQALLEQADDWF
jgi:tetratricopeptide (TPR) repeat protein